jgi:PilZ domain
VCGLKTKHMNFTGMDSGAQVKLERDRNDRRGADRFPIEREVRYKILNRKSVDEVGFGKTINMSSNGVLFSTEQHLLPGKRLEISISWPAQLDSKVSLKLVARGRVVRSEEGRAAIEIHQYEFRTQATQGTTVVQ